MSIRELLEKRTSEYDQLTQDILGLYEAQLLKALKFYMKTERTIHIHDVSLYASNKNFVINHVRTQFQIGDHIQTSNGDKHVITEDNMHDFKAETLKILLPVSLLEKADAFKIYEKLKEIDAFVEQYGPEKYQKCVDSGIRDLDDLLDESNESLLDELTDPIESIIASLDDVQKVNYMVFCNNMSKVIH
jgi:hypothetical protein